MAISGSIKKAITDYDELVFSWNRTKVNTTTNTSTISWTLKIIASDDGRIASNTAKDYEVKIDGKVVSYGTNTINVSNNGTRILASGTTDIKHSDDGTKTFSVSIWQDFNITFSKQWIGRATLTGTGTLDRIPRKSNISATNANIGSASTITINRYSADATHTLTYSFGGLTGTIATKTASTSVNWTVPTSFYTKIPNAKTGTATITCETFIDGDSVGTTSTTITATAAEANCKPTLNPVITDANNATVALTGDNTKLVRYFSTATTDSNAAARNSATLKSQKTTNGSSSITTETGTFANVSNPTFSFSATDSRGYTATASKTLSMVYYIYLTCNLTVNPPTVESGDLVFTIKGNYFNSTFGATNNGLTLYYRYKINSGEYGEWTEVSGYTLKDDTYTLSGSISGLDYLNTYTIQTRAVDKLMTVDSDEKVVNTLPVFDWGEKDFNFNVNVFFPNTNTKEENIGIRSYNSDGTSISTFVPCNKDDILMLGWGNYNAGKGKTNIYGNEINLHTLQGEGNININGNVSINGNAIGGGGKTLWSGGYYMTSGHTCNLSEGINKQPNGIVLVFSPIDGGNVDSNFQCFFVPKILVSLMPSKTHFFALDCYHNFDGVSNATHNFGYKLLTINNTSIVGNAFNDDVSPATAGYKNNRFVLRYVIGV